MKNLNYENFLARGREKCSNVAFRRALLITFIYICGITFSQNINTSLSACYVFDGTTTASQQTDGSGNSLNCTLNGNVTATVGHSGVANSALFIGGTSSDYILLPTNSLLQPSSPNNAISMSFWLKIGLDVNNYQFLIHSAINPSTTGCGFVEGMDVAFGTLPAPKVYATRDGSSQVTANDCIQKSASSPLIVVNNVWSHYVLVYTINSLEVYVNGAAMGVTTFTNLNFNLAISGMQIGGYVAPGGGWQAFQGSIDNLRIYNRALSINEASYLYSADPICTTSVNATAFSNIPGELGNDCGSSSNPLLANKEVPLGGYNFNFTGTTSVADKVNIGGSNCSSYDGKLNVLNTSSSSTSTSHYAIWGQNTYANGSNNINGIYGEVNTSTNTSTGLLSGIRGKATGSTNCIGVFGEGYSITNNSYGGYFKSVYSSGSNSNIGVYAEAANGGTNYAGWFNGQTHIVASSTAQTGLSFGNITSTNNPITNPGNGVLSLDANGKVIYSGFPSGIPQVGNYCSGSNLNSLTGNFRMNMNGWNYAFTAPSASLGNVSSVMIGHLSCSATPVARLDVYDDLIGKAIHGYADGTGGGQNQIAGVQGRSSNNVNTGISIGVQGDAIANSGNTYQQSFGGYFTVAGPAGAGYAAGVYGGLTTGVGGSINSGVVGDDGGTGAGNFAGYFVGNVNINGALSFTSDRKLKENIKPLNNTLEKLMQLKPSSYNFKTEEYSGMSLPNGEQMGLIAQDLEKVFPDLVKEVNGFKKRGESTKENQISFKTVQYISLIPLMIAGLQEQQTQILKQQGQIDELKTMLNNNQQKNNNSNTSISVILSDNNTCVLNQNVPNPFAENTVISYNIPQDFKKAQIIFSNNLGMAIRVVDITQKGQGALNVFANDLTHGMYSYVLVIDGVNCESHKMVKE